MKKKISIKCNGEEIGCLSFPENFNKNKIPEISEINTKELVGEFEKFIKTDDETIFNKRIRFTKEEMEKSFNKGLNATN